MPLDGRYESTGNKNSISVAAFSPRRHGHGVTEKGKTGLNTEDTEDTKEGQVYWNIRVRALSETSGKSTSVTSVFNLVFSVTPCLRVSVVKRTLTPALVRALLQAGIR